MRFNYPLTGYIISSFESTCSHKYGLVVALDSAKISLQIHPDRLLTRLARILCTMTKMLRIIDKFPRRALNGN